jgi:E3 ubiquitin-protein ligase RFWD2
MHSSSIGVAAAAAIHHAKIMTSNPSYGPGAGGVLGRATNGLYNGVKSSLENKNSDYNCPICFELLQEAHVTKCGHTFCHECIVKSLQLSSRCPKCNFHLEKPLEAIFPNFAINELVSKYRSRAQAINDHLQKPHFEGLRTALVDNGALLGMADVDYMLRFLAQRKEEIESESFLTQQLLLKDFLLHLKRQKDDQLYQLQKEGAVINGDLDKVKAAIDEFTSDNFVGQQLFHLDESSSNSGSSSPQPPTSKRFKPDGVVPSLQEQQQQLTVLTAPFGHALGQRKQRMHAHFDDLTHCYFSTRANDMLFPSAMKRSADEVPPMEDEGTSGATAAPEATEVSKVVQGQMGRVGTLDSFSNCLSKFTRYNSVRPLATLSYTSDMFSNASIVSSIEFDKDNEFFAIAGVTKRIKIYDYNVVIKDVVDVSNIQPLAVI